MRCVAALLLLVSVLAACTSTTHGHGGPGSSCDPVFFGVAGSGQGAENPPPKPDDVPRAVSRSDANTFGTAIGRLKTALTAIAGPQLASATAIDYPAIPVTRYIGQHELVGDLAVSEQTGVSALVDAIRGALDGTCADRSVLLAGYSQGAEVVILSVKALSAAQQAHVAVALFGNPSYLAGQPGDYPGNSAANGVRPSLHRGAYQLPADVRARTIDICAPLDGVCNVDPQRTSSFGKLEYVLAHTHAHTHDYAFLSRYAERAAHFLWNHR